MKKIILILSIFLFNMKIEAKIINYDITLIIQDDQIDVVEKISQEEPYFGFTKIIKTNNIYNDYYESLLSYTNKDIYQLEFELNNIYGISKLTEQITTFEKETSQKGDSNKYTITEQKDQLTIDIYNNSKENKTIVLNYTITNALIKHLDYYELQYNIFENLKEDIDKLTITIITDYDLKIYPHLEIPEIIEDENITLIYQNIKRDTNIDFKILFQTENLLEAEYTEIYIENLIEEKEEKLKENILEGDEEYQELKQTVYNIVHNAINSQNQDDYNEAIKKIELLNDEDSLKVELKLELIKLESQIQRKEIEQKVIISSVQVIWLLGSLILISYYVKKHFKKYPVELNEHYELNKLLYLKEYKINRKLLTLLIIDLIDQNKIKYQQPLTLILKTDELTELEQKLKKLLFKKNKITQTDIETIIESPDFKKNYLNFINSNYNIVRKEYMFDSLFSYKVSVIIYSSIGLILFTFLQHQNLYYSPYINLIVATFLLLTLGLYKRNYYGSQILNKYKNIESETVKLIFKNKANPSYKQLEKKINQILKKID